MKKINCLHLFSAVALLATHLTAGEIWITNGSSYSTSGGSAAAPVVIDTPAHFDTYMASVPANSHIHLMAGTFQTAAGIDIKSGWTIQGDGIDRTFIQASNMTSPWQIVDVVSSTYNPTNVYIQDVTIDCNMQNLPQKTSEEVGAVWLQGDDLHLTRVKAINFGSTVNGFEDFVLGLQFTNKLYAGTNFTIDGCIVTQPAPGGFANGGYINGIHIGASCGLTNEIDPAHVTSVGPGWVVGAEIKNCKVYGITASGNAISWGGLADVKIHDNTVLNCPNMGSTYCEDTDYSNLEIADNFFDGVAVGIGINDGDSLVRLRNNLSIHDNNINTVSGSAVLLASGSGTSLLNGVSIQNNIVTTPTGGNYTSWGIDVIGATNAVLTGNTVSSTTANAPLIFMQTVTNETVRNNESMNGPNLCIFDNTTGVTQGEQESTIVYSFIPSTTGWYRLTKCGNGLTGKAIIAYGASGDFSDIEASFTGNAYLGSDVGTITCTRDQNYGLAIDQLRIGSDTSTFTVYFDVHVATVDGSPVYVKLVMDAETAIFDLANIYSSCQPPTGLASTPTYASVLNLTQDGGLQMIGSLVVSNQLIVSANGLIKSSQLDSSSLTSLAGLTPSSGAMIVGNGSAWTASTSTSGPFGGYQYITTSTTLTGSSGRVVQASNVVTITLPSSPTLGKEFLFQNLNSSGTVTLGGTIVGSTTIAAGSAAVAVARPDGKWQVHSY